MRKLAMLSAALLSLAFATPSHAQPAQSGPQPGLPPGAAIGAPNAQQPRASGQVSTTPTGPQPTPAAPYADSVTAPPPPAHRVYHHRRRVIHHHYYRRHHVKASTPAPAAPVQ